VSPEAEVKDNPELHRYEIRLDGEVAGFATYRLRDGVVVFRHTEIDPAYEGHGLGSRLARAALDDARTSGRSVVPMCPFIKSYIDRHPEYLDLVTE
jgi:predicted GNAT family acetyltransferase